MTKGLKMEGSLARALARYLLESAVPPPVVLCVRVLYGLASQLPPSSDVAPPPPPPAFLPFTVYTHRHRPAHDTIQSI